MIRKIPDGHDFTKAIMIEKINDIIDIVNTMPSLTKLDKSQLREALMSLVEWVQCMESRIFLTRKEHLIE